MSNSCFFSHTMYKNDTAAMTRAIRKRRSHHERVASPSTQLRRFLETQGWNYQIKQVYKNDRWKLYRKLLNGVRLELSREAKHLGVVLDQKLTWKPHLEKVLKKATAAIWTCRRLLGRTWGLKPRMIHWSYITVVRPIVTYACVVWWQKTNEKTTQDLL